MANEQLQVIIGANVSNLEKGLKKADRELDRFKKSTVKGSRGIDAMGKSSANAVPALTSFSQVVQDAPFGIRGVANNITQLTQQFGYLQRSAGGTKAALKAMLGTLAGPAGILLIVSVVTSAMVAFGSSMGGAESKAKKLEKQLDNLNAKFDAELGLNKAISDNLKAQGKSTAAILGERNKIINAQIDSLSFLIQEQQELLKAKQRANEIVTVWEALAQLTGNAWKTVVNDIKTQNKALTSTLILLANRVGFEIDLSKFAPATKKDLEEQQQLQNTLNDLEKQRINLQTQKLKNEREITNQLRTQSELSQLQAGGIALPSISTSISETMNSAGATLKAGGESLLMETERIGQQLGQIVEFGIEDAFINIGDAIGQSLATGTNVLKSVGGALLGAIGNIAQQLGVYAIGIGLAIKGIKTALASLNPAAAIAAGTALLAIGAAFKSKASSLASGGTGSGFSGGSSSNSNFSSVSSSSSGFNGGRVVFEIAGDKLIGVLNNTSLGNLRVGDSDQLITTG